jgi:hypothetical protein
MSEAGESAAWFTVPCAGRPSSTPEIVVWELNEDPEDEKRVVNAAEVDLACQENSLRQLSAWD